MDTPRKPTIYEALADKLGRIPTHLEQCDEVARILDDSAREIAEAGKTRRQRPAR